MGICPTRKPSPGVNGEFCAKGYNTMNAAGKVLKYKMRQEAAERLGLVGDGSNTAENPNG